jgi:hypothetical protein
MDTSVDSDKEEYLVTLPIGLTLRGSVAAPNKKANLELLSKSSVPITSSTTTHTKAAQLVPLFHRCSYIPVPQSLHSFLLPLRPITVADCILTRTHYASFLPKIPQLDFHPLLWTLFTETPAAHKTLTDTALHHDVWLWGFHFAIEPLDGKWYIYLYYTQIVGFNTYFRPNLNLHISQFCPGLWWDLHYKVGRKDPQEFFASLLQNPETDCI